LTEDERRQDENEQPEAERPEPPEPGGPEAEQPPTESETSAPAGDEPRPEEPAAEEPQGEAPAAEAPPAEEPGAEAPEAESREAPAPGESPRDVVPGAELEPITLEPERRLDAEERARLEAEEEERRRREAEATGEGEEPVARRGPTVEIPSDTRIQATGKRKSSIARVVVRPGSGGFEINSRSLDEYFPRQYLRTLVRQPLLTAGYEDAVDVRVRVHGGGITGQAGAVRHAVARALCEIEPELRPELKRRGLLTRDARIKERRKAGLKKARKRPQFSKR
jgi:small subunit ribosomal protein S9